MVNEYESVKFISGIPPHFWKPDILLCCMSLISGIFVIDRHHGAQLIPTHPRQQPTDILNYYAERMMSTTNTFTVVVYQRNLENIQHFACTSNSNCKLITRKLIHCNLIYRMCLHAYSCGYPYDRNADFCIHAITNGKIECVPIQQQETLLNVDQT